MGHRRVHGHDYHAKGYYFITFTTRNRRHWLSRIVRGTVVLEPAGQLLLDAWHKIADEDPAYDLGVTAVMPDHFHAIAIACRPPKYVIGTHVARVEGRVLHAMRKHHNDPDQQIWDNGFYDYLSLNSKMLHAFENYIRDNPMRWQLRRDHPEWFKKQYALNHPRLPGETTWIAYGDATILDHPNLIPVIISTRLTESELTAQIANILTAVREGGIPIGGFISPGERIVEAEVTKLPRSRIIKLQPWGLKHYKPSGALATRWLATGRRLILTGFADDEPAQCRRANCLQNNLWVQQIAASSSVGPLAGHKTHRCISIRHHTAYVIADNGKTGMARNRTERMGA